MTTRITPRRAFELAFPAAIAHRLVAVLIPMDGADAAMLNSAATVFNSVLLEPVEGWSDRDKAKHIRRLIRARTDMLDRYENRAVVTVVRAFADWLNDLTERGILSMAADGPFMACWEALSTAICARDENLAALEACRRSAGKMAGEWRQWTENQGYYKGFDQ